MAKKGKGKSKKKTVKKTTKETKSKTVKKDPSLKKGIVRIANNDLDGHLKLRNALLHIKGIGHSLAHALLPVIEERFKIDGETKLGTLEENQIEELNKFLFSIDSSVVPSHLLNNRKNFYNGKDVHYIENDLIFSIRQDVKREMDEQSWRGYRHSRGKKVRGQRTKNTGRGGLTVGVIRKKD